MLFRQRRFSSRRAWSSIIFGFLMPAVTAMVMLGLMDDQRKVIFTAGDRAAPWAAGYPGDCRVFLWWG
jgi:hypothetical protein